MARMWTQLKKKFQRETESPSPVKLVDRTACPAFLSLRRLTHDPDLRRHVSSHARQLRLDLELPVPDDAPGFDACTCPDRIDAEVAASRLARSVAANEDGWQDGLARALVAYAASHLSANMDAGVHRALAAPLDWRAYCGSSGSSSSSSSSSSPDHRACRASPVAVVEAAARAVGSRLEGESGGLRRCAALGALLDVVVGRVWRACEGFRAEEHFREHVWVRDGLVVGAFETYLLDPSREAFEVAVGDLELGLAGRRLCVCGGCRGPVERGESMGEYI